MKIPYPRPTKLSDPSCDFSPEKLQRILAIPDDELGWRDLRDLLGPFLPAGTYEESVYFLPFGFQELQREEGALDLTTSVSGFISRFADDLERDGLQDECRAEMERCLLRWVSEFRVEHFDRRGCAAKGWGLDYFDYVRGTEVVCETLRDLDRFVRHADLVDGFIVRLAESEDAVSCAWFLELVRARGDVRPPPPRETFQRYVTDRRLLAEKAAIIREDVAIATVSPTYWNDVFRKLGLEV